MLAQSWTREKTQLNAEVLSNPELITHYFLCLSWQITSAPSTPDNGHPSSLSPRPERKVELFFRDTPLPSSSIFTLFIHCNSDIRFKYLLSTVHFTSGIIKMFLISLLDHLSVYDRQLVFISAFVVCFSSEKPQCHF